MVELSQISQAVQQDAVTVCLGEQELAQAMARTVLLRAAGT